MGLQDSSFKKELQLAMSERDLCVVVDDKDSCVSQDNIEARLKYPNRPDRFANSEIDLHDDLQKLSIIVGAPELYLDLINLNAIPSILNLLAHDNTDITVDVDLTDPDVFEDDEESDELARVLVDMLVGNNVLELLVQNLLRLNDSDPNKMAAVYNTLTTVENLVEVKPAVAEMLWLSPFTKNC
ncbi:beta-catenin-like protein 1 [Quercus suber]|uniref:Beta-catenin-like protein 1 n=1 Tax=Quercus suber TaxID=58331 RepID=A0AAW0LYW4_QUESU